LNKPAAARQASFPIGKQIGVLREPGARLSSQFSQEILGVSVKKLRNPGDTSLLVMF
jgi:hypothetical protein